MVILLQINKITFEKSENLGIKFTSVRIWLKFEQKIVVFLKKVFFMVFLNCQGGNGI